MLLVTSYLVAEREMSRLALSLRLVDGVYSAVLDELAVDEAISLRLVDGVYSTVLDELAVDEGGENGTISAECDGEANDVTEGVVVGGGGGGLLQIVDKSGV